MEKKELRRGLVAPLLVSLLGFGAFLRMPGSENVRAVHIVALLGCGMGLGVALAFMRVLLGMGSGK
jgi:hypothetical protein